MSKKKIQKINTPSTSTSPSKSLETSAKILDGNKWRKRYFILQKATFGISGSLHIFKTAKSSRKTRPKKRTLTIDGFFGVESGFSFADERYTLAIICRTNIIVLAFGNQTTLSDWEWFIRNSFGYGYQYSVFALEVPTALSSITNTYIRLHLRDGRFCLVGDSPPRVLADFRLGEIRRFGSFENKFCVEAGTRTGSWSGVYVFRTGHCDRMADTFRLASYERLHEYLSSDDVGEFSFAETTPAYELLTKTTNDRQFERAESKKMDENDENNSTADMEYIACNQWLSPNENNIHVNNSTTTTTSSSFVRRFFRVWRRIIRVKSPDDSHLESSPYYAETRPLLEKSHFATFGLKATRNKLFSNTKNLIDQCKIDQKLQDIDRIGGVDNPDFIAFTPPISPLITDLSPNLDISSNTNRFDNRQLPIDQSMDTESITSPSELLPRSALPRLEGHVFKFIPIATDGSPSTNLNYAKLASDDGGGSCPLPMTKKSKMNRSMSASLLDIDANKENNVEYAQIDSIATQAARKVIKLRKKDISDRFSSTQLLCDAPKTSRNGRKRFGLRTVARYH